jgi:hypothetical protein
VPLLYQPPKHKEASKLGFEVSPIEHIQRGRLKEKSYKLTEALIENYNGVERYFDKESFNVDHN